MAKMTDEERAAKEAEKAKIAAEKAKAKAIADKAKAKVAAEKEKAKIAAEKEKAKIAAQNEKAAAKAARDAERMAARAAKTESAEGEAKSGGVVDRSRYTYETHKEFKTPSGRASVDNGDPLAAVLRGKTAEQVIELVVSNGGETKETWSNLNSGLQRMAAGNVLRKLAKRTEGIKIDGKKLVIAA